MRGVLQLFHKRSKDLFWNCSRTKLICSRTVLGKTFRIFWNFSRTNFLTSARTIVEQKIVPFNVLHSCKEGHPLCRLKNPTVI